MTNRELILKFYADLRGRSRSRIFQMYLAGKKIFAGAEHKIILILHPGTVQSAKTCVY